MKYGRIAVSITIKAKSELKLLKATRHTSSPFLFSFIYINIWKNTVITILSSNNYWDEELLHPISDAIYRGCFFHCSQCLWRMSYIVNQSDTFCIASSTSAALAYVPERDVVKAFEELLWMRRIYTALKMKICCNYWSTTSKINEKASSTLFPAKLGLPRTNNSV